MKGQIKAEWYEKNKAESTYCKRKGHFVQVCLKKARDTMPGILASILISDRATSDGTEQNLVVDSRRIHQLQLNKNSFKSLLELDTTVTNQDCGNAKFLGNRRC